MQLAGWRCLAQALDGSVGLVDLAHACQRIPLHSPTQSHVSHCDGVQTAAGTIHICTWKPAAWTQENTKLLSSL
jgi:hypothetical protein